MQPFVSVSPAPFDGIDHTLLEIGSVEELVERVLERDQDPALLLQEIVWSMLTGCQERVPDGSLDLVRLRPVRGEGIGAFGVGPLADRVGKRHREERARISTDRIGMSQCCGLPGDKVPAPAIGHVAQAHGVSLPN